MSMDLDVYKYALNVVAGAVCEDLNYISHGK